MNWSYVIQKRLDSKGWTQADLVRAIKKADPLNKGITKGYLSELLSGKRKNPHVPALIKIAGGFGVKFWTLAKEAEKGPSNGLTQCSEVLLTS